MAPAKMTPFLDETLRFLSALDLAPNARFAFATFDDRHERCDHRLAARVYGNLHGAVRLTGPKRGQLCSTVSLLGFLQSRGAGVFVTVQSVDGAGATAQHVNRIRAFHADADDDRQLASLQRFVRQSGLLPSILVASGGTTGGGHAKVQAYWRVRDCPVRVFGETEALLLSRCGTDLAAKDLARVFRLPGFIHQKREPRMTRILAVSDADYDLGDFVTRVHAQPLVQEMSAVRGCFGGTCRHNDGLASENGTGDRAARLRTLVESTGSIVTPAVKRLIDEAKAPAGAEPGNRHNTLLAIVTRLAGDWHDLAIRQLVLPRVHDAWGDGDWSKELDNMLVWVRKKEAAAEATSQPGEMLPSGPSVKVGGPA